MISLAHKTLFVHIPKCGGQSVEETFANDLGLNWNLQRRLLLCFPKPADWHGETNLLAHLTASEYLEGKYISKPLFRQFFKFAIVRNPFRKVESHFTYAKFDKSHTFEEFVINILPNKVAKKWVFRPQTHYLSGKGGSLLIDNIYHLENIKNDWPEIQGKSGVRLELSHKNRSKSTKKRFKWNEAMAGTVQSLFAEDFENFGYDINSYN